MYTLHSEGKHTPPPPHHTSHTHHHHDGPGAPRRYNVNTLTSTYIYYAWLYYVVQYTLCDTNKTRT
jgi:hypothetical protein